MDWLITSALAAALAIAWWRQRDRVVTVLAVAFAASTVFGGSVQMSFVPAIVGLFDGAVVLAMLAIATMCHASECGWCERGQRARFIGWVGVAKLAASLAAVPPLQAQWLDWWWYAAMINAGFMMQVAIAGGWLNGLAVFLHRHRYGAGGIAVGGSHHRTGA